MIGLALLLAAAPAFAEQACADAALIGKARCGAVAVPEDRDRLEGRVIRLNVVIVPADGPATALPLFDLEGGPGLAVTRNAGFYLTDGAIYRKGRDIVLIDQRGTGRSHPLLCPELVAPEAAYQPLYPQDAVERCRRDLEKDADLTRYGTMDAVADLDAVRAALGHDRIDLQGLSYGTIVALRYLATYPQRVHAAVLFGVVPASAVPPGHHATAAERALKLLDAQCAADAACAAAGFRPSEDLARALLRLPQIANAPDPEVFAEKIRSMMYGAAGARRVPYILHRAAEGDLAPFLAATRPDGPSPFAEGMYLSVTCGESIALMNYEGLAGEARATQFGDYRLRRQRDACRHWPAARTAKDHLEPVRAPAAVLLVSGNLDPVTPPDWAAEVARTLPNARHIVIPDGGHIVDGLSALDTCLDPLVTGFLDKGDAKAIDASCIATMRPPPFTIAETAER